MMDEGTYRGRDAHVPTATLARDPFTEALRALKRNPEAVEAVSRIDVMDDVRGMTTWNIDLFRKEGEVTALIQIGAHDGSYQRIVMPPAVTKAIARHLRGTVAKAAKKRGRRERADLAAQTGEVIETRKRARRHK